jgi:hypothetical protein
MGLGHDHLGKPVTLEERVEQRFREFSVQQPVFGKFLGNCGEGFGSVI